MTSNTILIIDDDPEFLDLLAMKVRQLGHQVHTATGLEQGVSALDRHHAELVFLDVNLPDGSGLEAIARIKATTCSPEVIIVTGEGEADGAALAIESGAWDYLQKGRSLQELVLPLQHALDYRRERLAARRTHALELGEIIGSSAALRTAFDRLAQAAASDTNVLLRGETGTGKELFARAIHRNSARRSGEFVVVDCAALPATLVESILFGHERGSFTGAEGARTGLVRRADGGTLFLDEVGEMPLSLQKSFLRVLQEKRFRPVGAEDEVSSDFRLVVATNRDLEARVEQGAFRNDLLYRLRSLDILLPPLRERAGDIAELTRHLVPRICNRNGIADKVVSPALLAALEQYPWPGNVRELTHTLERAVAVAAHQQLLLPVHLPTAIRVLVARSSVQQGLNTQPATHSYPKIQDVRNYAEADYLRTLLSDADGDIDRACSLAQLSRSRLYELLKKHGISRTSA